MNMLQDSASELHGAKQKELLQPLLEGEALPVSSTPQAATAPAAAPQPEPGGDGAAQLVSSSTSAEMGMILRIATPLALENCIWFTCSSLIGLAFVGNLGKKELAAVVLGNSIFNVTGNSVCIGLAAGMETLCSQAFGAGRYETVGLLLQRALLINLLTCGLIIAVWSQLHLILPAIGQNPETSERAARYVLLCTPALLFSCVSQCLRNYLMAQVDVVAASALSVGVVAVTPLINWALIYRAGLGTDGAAHSNNAETLLYLLAITAYVAWKERRLAGTERKTWQGWSVQAFHKWGAYLSIAFPGLLKLTLEWWLIEMVVVLSGLLPDSETAISSSGIAFQVVSLAFMAALSLSDALGTRVGNQIGLGSAQGARRSFFAALVLGLAYSSVCSVLLTVLRRQLPRIFSRDADVLAQAATIMPILAVSTLFDGISCVASGVIVGTGRQLWAAVINLISNWAIGFPLALLLAFVWGRGVQGLWLGLAIATTTQGLSMLAYVSRLDFRKEVSRSRHNLSLQSV